jgi:hypothetical protein
MNQHLLRAALGVAATVITTMAAIDARAEDLTKRPCKEWVAERRNGGSKSDEMLVLGFAGYYQMQEDFCCVPGPDNADPFYQWLDAYCANHPSTSLNEASLRFVLERKSAQRKQ